MKHALLVRWYLGRYPCLRTLGNRSYWSGEEHRGYLWWSLCQGTLWNQSCWSGGKYRGYLWRCPCQEVSWWCLWRGCYQFTPCNCQRTRSLHFRVFHVFSNFEVDFYSARTVAVNMSKCMLYVVWCVKFKGSLLVEAVQSWPLIGRFSETRNDGHEMMYWSARCCWLLIGLLVRHKMMDTKWCIGLTGANKVNFIGVKTRGWKQG